MPRPTGAAARAGAPGPPRSAALLDHLARRMRVRSESAMAEVGLRPRHLVTLTVLREQGGSTQQALAGTLRIDRTNLVGLLNELESQGLVARRRSEEDRRKHVVELTDQGARRLAEAEEALGTAEDDVLRALDPADRATLAALLLRATREDPADCAAAAAAPDPAGPLANPCIAAGAEDAATAPGDC